jgi:hypothetical protein
MARINEQTVWVLGAGFSQPLGGPLLKDLFRQQRFSDLAAEFSADLYPGLASEMFWIQALYQWGREVEGLWGNAEDFLHYVDEDSESKRAIVRFTCGRMGVKFGEKTFDKGSSGDSQYTRTLERFKVDIQRISRRALAAECHRFLVDRNVKDDEMWIPYADWVSKLSLAVDTILTFNYDLVLDMCSDNRLESVLPESDRSKKLEISEATVPVIKLHGSVDWARRQVDDRAKIQRIEATQILKTDDEIAIAAPGRSKAPSVKRDFPTLWTYAEEKLAKADRIIFLGYSFPKTDALARQKIIGAIARNESTSVVRVIDVVLGPEIGHASVQRVLAMLEGAKGDRRVHRGGVQAADALLIRPHRMWVEDFISNFAAHLPTDNEPR